MASITTSTVAANDLPVHAIELPGTRALTVLVAFDAGARNESPAGERHGPLPRASRLQGRREVPQLQDVNETAERLGGVLNAYTSHDLVAFHITVRAESAAAAIDLLTDFVGRPRIDRRGARPRARRRDPGDQPRLRSALDGRRVPDRPGRLRRPPAGRPVLGPEENLRSFTREGIVAFRERRWAGGSGGAFLAGNLDHLPGEDELHECFGRFPALPEPGAYEAAPGFAPRDAGRGAGHQPVPSAHDLPPRDRRHRCPRAGGADDLLDALGGSMGSRLFEEIREKRGLCYSVYAIYHAFADVPILQLGSGLESSKCIEAYTRMREIVDELRGRRPDRGGGPARPRLRRRSARPGLREHQRRGPPRGQPVDRLRRGHRPRRGDRGDRRCHLRRGSRGRGGVAETLRSPASARTRPTSSRLAPTARRPRRPSRSRPCGRSAPAHARATSSGTRTSYLISRRASRSFGSVIIFMNTHEASALAGMNSTSGRRHLQRVEHPRLGRHDRLGWSRAAARVSPSALCA